MLTTTTVRYTVILAISVSIFGPLILTSAQTGENRLEKYDWPNEPVNVVSLYVGTQKIKLGKPFPSTEDWADHLRVTVENTSGKSIKYLRLQLRFRRTDDASARYLLFLDWPEELRPDQQGRPVYSDKLLRPGEQATLSTHIHVAYGKETLARRGRAAQFHQARLDIIAAAFEDGTHWAGGDIFREDPQNPTELIKIDNGALMKLKSNPGLGIPFGLGLAAFVQPNAPQQGCYLERRAFRTCSFGVAGCPSGTRARCFTTLVYYVDTNSPGSSTAISSDYTCTPSEECVTCATVDIQAPDARCA